MAGGGPILCAKDSHCGLSNNKVCLIAAFNETVAGEYRGQCGCETWFGFEEDASSGSCTLWGPHSVYMMIDTIVQLILCVLTLTYGYSALRGLLRMRWTFNVPISRDQRYWRCVGECMVSAVFLGLHKIMLVAQMLLPENTVCCEKKPLFFSGQDTKHHILRYPAVVFLYLAVIFSVVAIHSVAFIFVAEVQRLRKFSEKKTKLCMKRYGLFLDLSVAFYVFFCIVLQFVMPPISAVLGLIFPFTIAAAFVAGERCVMYAVKLAEEWAESHGESMRQIMDRLKPRTVKWQREMREMRIAVCAVGIVLFLASALYLSYGWNDVGRKRVKQFVNWQAAGNNWIGGAMLLYVLVALRFMQRKIREKYMLLQRKDWERRNTPTRLNTTVDSQQSSVTITEQAAQVKEGAPVALV